MKVSYGEGLASHAGPESWRFPREGLLQALTGESTGRVLSREIARVGSADDFVLCGRQHFMHHYGEMHEGSPRSETSARMEASCTETGRSHRWPCPPVWSARRIQGVMP